MGFLSKLFGKKVKVPEFVKIDADEQQGSAIAGNRKYVGQAAKLALEQQAADQAALEQGLKQAIPGYEGLVGGQRDVIDDFLGGRVPKDVADKMADRAAARGISTGTQGSQAIDYSELRNYGLTSLDMKREGVGMAQNYIAQQSAYGMAKPMSVTSMFFSPQQRLAHETSERNLKFQRDMAANKMDAAPDPRYVGVAKIAAAAAGGIFGAAAGAAGTAASAMGAMQGASIGSSMFGGGGGGGGNMMAMAAMAQQYGQQGSQVPITNIPGQPAQNIGGYASSEPSSFYKPSSFGGGYGGFSSNPSPIRNESGWPSQDVRYRF
jgi:hypothetical protein